MKRSSQSIRGRSMNKSIAILGPGAIGGFLAAVFFKAGHRVVCIAKRDTVESIRSRGITLESSTFGSFTARPDAVESLDRYPDIIFITTKAINLEDALERIDPMRAESAVIVPLLNGIEHVAVLRHHFGNRVIAGTIGIEVMQSDSGVIEHLTKHARLSLAVDDNELKSQLPEMITLLTEAGLEARIGESEAEILWRKLVRLNALACTTAVTGKTIGEIRNDDILRKDLELMVKEASEVAAAQGAKINPEVVMKELDRLEATQRSSLQRDRASGKELEADAIAGAIVRAGTRHRISCPTIADYLKKLTQ